MHTAEGNTCTVHVSATLLMLGYLSIQGELQQMLAPFAGQRLSVDIGKGKPLQCRLNAAGDRIRSRKLADYVIDAGTLDFTATLRDGTLFLHPQISNELLTTKKLKQPSKSNPERAEEPASPGTAVPEPKSSRQIYIQTSLFEDSETGSLKADPGVKQHRSSVNKEISRRKKNSRDEEKKRLAEIKKEAEKALLKLAADIAVGQPKAKKTSPVKKAKSPTLRHREQKQNKEMANPTGVVKTPDVAPPNIYQPAQATNEQSTKTSTAAREMPDSNEKAQETPPVRISFSSEKDAAILKLAETGTVSPAADLYLHRQALALLLSPGFDTLLSINAVQNIKLLEYQLATVRHVLKNLRGRALLCDEVGLGKTIEAGLIMMEYLLRGLVRRVLILTPPSLVEQWREEMQTRFNLDFITYDAAEFKTTPRPWSSFPRIIASIDTAKREPHKDMVLEPIYDLVIVDEAHHLKKQRTQAYQLVSQLKKKYILLLTATPVENNLEELFNLITLLQPGQLETASAFKKKYITRGDPLKPKNAEELKKLVREIMVRNRRSETGIITARRHAEVVEVTLSPAEAAFYQRLTSFVRGYYTPGSAGTIGGVNQFVLKTLQREVGSSIEAVLPTLGKIAAGDNHPAPLKRLAGALIDQAGAIPQRAKAEALAKLLQNIPEKVIVFTCFRETQRFLAEFLRREGLSVAELHGGMRRAEKEEQVRAFTDNARVLVSTETGSEGRNLQFCHILVNYDLPWNPMRIEQRIGRIHRLGQEKDVYIYNLSAAGTVEAYILDLLDAKINMFQLVVGELDMILGNLQDKRDFEDMIMDLWAKAEDEAKLKAGLDELGNRLAAAKEHYLAVKELDDQLLGELRPEE